MFRYKEPIRTKLGTMDLYRELCRDEIPILKDGKPNIFVSRSCWAGDPKGSKTNVLVIGDSFARHLLGAFDELGKKRGEQYRFSFTVGCRFLPHSYSRKNEGCTDLEKKRWAMMDKLKVNHTIVVGNLWGYNSMELHMRKVLGLQSDIKKRGHNVMIAGEAPGLDEQEAGRFSCLELHLLPIGKITDLWFRRRNRCVDQSRSLLPRPKMFTASKTYKSMFDKLLKREQFIDIFDALCEERDGQAYCSPPIDLSGGTIGMQNFGYERDLCHFTIEGSRYISSIIGRYLTSRTYQRVKNPEKLPFPAS